MRARSIPLCIILSIVTCGIYSLYWFVVMTDDANRLSQSHNQPSGITALLLTIITCNIYGIYWAYKMGEKLDIAYAQNGLPTQNLAMVYLILELFIPIVGWALMQNTINTLIFQQDSPGM